MTRDAKRSYLASHPWISFNADLTAAQPRLWMLLGEAASKCEHLAGVPLRQDTANRLHQIYMAKGVLATTAIEGNTLSESQALEAVEGHLKVPASLEYQAQELNNIIEAVNVICEDVRTEADMALTSADIDTYNHMVLRDLQVGSGVVPGEIRTGSVMVGNVYRGAPAQDCDYLLDRLCSWLNGPAFAGPPGQELPYAILRAVLAHLYIAWIHPYGDGNGRTARLVEFHLLVSNGVPTPAAHLLSNHYNQTRTEYYRQLAQASRGGGEVIPFISYALQGFVDGLADQIDLVRNQQFELTWDAVVAEIVTGHSPSDVRRKKLAMALFRAGEPVAKADLRDLTPELARLYAQVTEKALSRDLNSPPLRHLIEKTLGGYRARREIISAFLPIRGSAS
jgi:Fic family protein